MGPLGCAASPRHCDGEGELAGYPGRPNPGQYSIKIGNNSINREAHDGVAEITEIFVSLGIILALHVVDIAVYFDDRAVLWADEIDNVGTNRMLPTELLAVQPMMPESIPE